MNISDSLNDREYGEIFYKRGNSYHEAMMSFPMARDNEFSSIFSKKPLKFNEYLLDIPAGGGYLEFFLKRHMPHLNISVQNLEFTSGFGPNANVVSQESLWPVEQESCDRVICLAAAHHINDLSKLYCNLKYVLKSGGIFHLIDVAPDSGVQLFLENFVDKYTPGGHRGLYRDFFSEIYPPCFEILDISIRSCPWMFQDLGDLLDFCTGLFGLQECPRDALEIALCNYIGVHFTCDYVSLNWELAYADMILK